MISTVAVTDIRIHQTQPVLEVAFNTGQVFQLPWQVRSLQMIDSQAVTLQFADGRQVQYDWQQLYDEAQTTA